MDSSLRQLAGVIGSLAAFAGSWALCRYVIGLDEGTSWAVAGAVLAVVLAQPLTRRLIRISNARLAEAAGDLAADVLGQVILDQERLLGDEGQPEPANIRFGRPSLVRWRSDNSTQRGSLEQVAAFYAGLRRGRLVILGEEGAGKTVLANQLIIDLITRRSLLSTEVDIPAKVPVRLSLPSFDIEGSHPDAGAVTSLMDAWIANELVSVFGLKTRMAKMLVERGWILPVLDGLDEMIPVSGNNVEKATGFEEAADVIRALNHPIRGGLRAVVVTCRTKSYNQLASGVPFSNCPLALQDATAIQIEPLSGKQVADYIRYRFPHPARPGQVEDRWQRVLDDLKGRRPGALADALASPLRLFMAVSIYQTPVSRPIELTKLTYEQINDRLLSKFIPALTDQHSRPGGGHYHPEEVTSWLRTLAQYLRSQQHEGGSGSDLDLSQLWKAAGKRLPRYLAAILYGASAGMLLLLSTGLYVWSAGHLFAPTFSDRLAANVCAVVAVLVAWGASRPTTTLSRLPALRTPHGRRNLARGLTGAIDLPLEVAVSAVLGLLGWLTVELAAAHVGRRTADLAGVGTALFAIALSRWRLRGRPGLHASILKAAPTGALLVGAGLWLGIWRNIGLQGWLITGLILLAVSLAVGLIRGLTQPPSAISQPSELVAQGLRYYFVAGIAQLLLFVLLGAAIGWLAIGLVRGVAVGLALGFYAAASWNMDSPWLRYFIATHMLDKRRLPQRPAQFLDWAYDAGLLRLSGISIQFRHREMQDYLIATDSSLGQKPVERKGPAPSWRVPATITICVGAAATMAIALVGVNILPSAPYLAPLELQAGDCIRSLHRQSDNGRLWPAASSLVACTDQPAAEILVAKNSWPLLLEYPGHRVLARQADRRCLRSLRVYTGIQYWGKRIAWTPITPNPAAWDSGDRALLCVAYEPMTSKPSESLLHRSIGGIQESPHPRVGGSTIPLVACPTAYGAWKPHQSHHPATITTSLAPAIADKLAFYSDLTLSVQPILGPRGWACSTDIGADGSTTMDLFSLGQFGTWPQLVEAHSDSACQGCIFETVCSVVTNVSADMHHNYFSCPARPPQEIVTWRTGSPAVTKAGKDVIQFTDPPRVRGDGEASGGPYYARGVILFSWARTHGASASIETCTLATINRRLCQEILNTFRKHGWPGRA